MTALNISGSSVICGLAGALRTGEPVEVDELVGEGIRPGGLDPTVNKLGFELRRRDGAVFWRKSPGRVGCLNGS